MAATARACECDMVEIRLDYLAEPAEPRFLQDIGKSVIASCMPSWEGGRFRGSEEERLSVLHTALEFSDYVTLELNTGKKMRDGLIGSAKRKGVKVIVSYHDFEKTPSLEEIRRIISSEKSCGADVVKIAFKAENEEDVLNTLHPIVEEKHTPVIAVSMGEQGKPSRILGPLLGGFLTYGFPDGRKPSAPGQFSVGELTRILGGLS
jgi:3-dehydroquinate dehydratase type I